MEISNGKMNSNVYSTNVRAAQGEDGIPFIRVTADYPGQDIGVSLSIDALFNTSNFLILIRVTS